MKPYLSVIIPCYNEQQNLERGVLEEVSNFFKKQNYQYEVVISDDASTDNSKQLIKNFVANHPQFRLLENKHGGKAWALKYGLSTAEGEYVLFTDMDQSTPISEVNNLLPFTKNNFEIVIGSRGSKRLDATILRKAAAKSFRIFRKSLLLRNIEDTQCGFKLAKTKVAQHIFDSMLIFTTNENASGWVVAAWDVEFLFLAQKFGYNTKEVKVEWSDKDESTEKNRSLLKFAHESIDMFKQVTRVRMNEIHGKYK